MVLRRRFGLCMLSLHDRAWDPGSVAPGADEAERSPVIRSTGKFDNFDKLARTLLFIDTECISGLVPLFLIFFAKIALDQIRDDSVVQIARGE